MNTTTTTTAIIRATAASAAVLALAGCGTFDRFTTEEGSLTGAGAGALVGAAASGGVIVPALAAVGGAVVGDHLAAPDPASAAGSTPAMQGGLFESLDDDRSGALDAAELKDSAGVDRDAIRFDTDRDGRISRAEFNANYSVEPGR